MEVTIIKGQFEPNKLGMRIGIVGVVLFSILCLGLLFIIGPLSILCIGPMIALYGCVIYTNHALKYQELTVTNLRVYGKIKKKEINLPFDKITHVDLNRKKCITITTASGIIICPSCVNGNAVYSAINNVLNNRAFYQMGSFVEVPTAESHLSSNSTNVVAELKEYKELLDNQLITQEEYDRKKKQLLGL